LPISSAWQRTSADAVLIIGDRAMTPPPPEFPLVWDLGERWVADTGHPFVFAVWAAARRERLETMSAMLNAARDRGLAELSAIAREQCEDYGLSAEQCAAYFSRHLHFELGIKELAGLERFYVAGRDLGLFRRCWELNAHHDCQVIG
jgi:chorismate dehydratase